MLQRCCKNTEHQESPKINKLVHFEGIYEGILFMSSRNNSLISTSYF